MPAVPGRGVLGEMFFLKHLSYRHSPQGLARLAQSSALSPPLCHQGLRLGPTGRGEDGRTCPRAGEVCGLHPRKGRLSGSSAPPSQRRERRRPSRGAPWPAVRAGSGGGARALASCSREQLQSPQDSRWTNGDRKAGSTPRPHPGWHPCAGRRAPGIALRPKRFRRQGLPCSGRRWPDVGG